MLVTFLLSMWQILLDLLVWIYLALHLVPEQGWEWGRVWSSLLQWWCFGVSVAAASEDLDRWDSLCLITHHCSALMGEKQPWRTGRDVGEASDLPLSSQGWGSESFNILVSSSSLVSSTSQSWFNNKLIPWLALFSTRMYKEKYDIQELWHWHSKSIIGSGF